VPQVGDYIADFLRVAIPSIVSGVGDDLSLIILEEEVVNRGRAAGGGDEDRIDVGERTGGTKTVERFVFQFQMEGAIGGIEGRKFEPNRNNNSTDIEKPQAIAMKHDAELASEARAQMERSMRECLLRVLALRRRRRRKDEKAENMSFKLCLHVAEDKKQQDIVDIDADEVVGEARSADSCPELMNALQHGEWLQPKQSSCLFSSNSNTSAEKSSKGLLRPIKDVNLPSCGMKMQMGMEVDPF